MATYNKQKVRLNKYGECHLVDNADRKFGSSDIYYAAAITFHNQMPGMGKELPDGVYLFTHIELAKALERAQGNREDLPEVKKNWLLRLLGY